MIKKVKNQLIGIVVIITIGAILLPSLLTEQKTYLEYEFSKIPLSPKNSQYILTNIIPSVIQPLSKIPQMSQELDNTQIRKDSHNIILTQNDHGIGTVNTKNIQHNYKHIVELKLQGKSVKQQKIIIHNKPSTECSEEKAPQGVAYVIQLSKVHDIDQAGKIVRKLRLHGYHVYTRPTFPVLGGIFYLLVGPDTSKKKLQSILPEIKRLSDLNGQILSYNCN